MQPASASMQPAAAAAITRGQRQSSSAVSPRFQLQPSSPRPRPSARTMPTAKASSSGSRRRAGNGWRAKLCSSSRCGWPPARCRRGSSQSSRGAPSRAVAAPVGTSSARLPARRWMPRSVTHSSRPPSSGAQIRRWAKLRAPSRRTRAGAARPMKLITPTTLTTQAARYTDRVRLTMRRKRSGTPRLFTPLSSSSSKASGRSNGSRSSRPMARRGNRNCTPLQLFWLSEPEPQINTAFRSCCWTSIRVTFSALR